VYRRRPFLQRAAILLGCNVADAAQRSGPHPGMMAPFGIGVVVGPVLGPVLGGYLTEDYTGVMCSISTDRSGSSAFLA
jgi:hypothetical protein